MNELTEKVRERFEGDTAEHEMTVLLDNDVHRHLRFRKPGTIMYGFEIITWPGYLAVVGDCGDYVFARQRDMFEFFVLDRGINPHYWSEKLQAPKPDAALRFSHEKLASQLREWFEEREYDVLGNRLDARTRGQLWGAIERQIIDVSANEHEAHQLIYNFEHKGNRGYFTDTWEWDLRDYDWSFLWCCWAIVWGIGVYRGQERLLSRPEFTT